MKPKALILLFIIVIGIMAAVFTIKPVRSPKTAHVGSILTISNSLILTGTGSVCLI